MGKSTIQKIAEVSLGKAVYRAAAANHLAKLLRTNVVTSAVTIVVISGPDFYRAAIGSALPVVGTAIGGFVAGILGAIAGVAAASAGSKYLLDGLIEDDAEEMVRLLPGHLVKTPSQFTPLHRR